MRQIQNTSIIYQQPTVGVYRGYTLLTLFQLKSYFGARFFILFNFFFFKFTNTYTPIVYIHITVCIIAYQLLGAKTIVVTQTDESSSSV